MKPSVTPRSAEARRAGKRASTATRGDIDARTLARLRAAAAIVRHRQEMLYDRLAERFRLACEQAVDGSLASMQVAAEKAREQLTAAGALTEQQGLRLKTFLMRDLEHTAAELRAVEAGTAELLEPARLGEGAIASIAAVVAAARPDLPDAAHDARRASVFRTGEVTSAGMLTCGKCGTNLHFPRTGTVPPCPKCPSTVFRKGC